MKNHLSLMLAVCITLSGCSSSHNLRKFDERDIVKEIPSEVVKRFEVVAVGTPVQAAPATAPSKKKKDPKGKVGLVAKGAVKVQGPPNRRPEKMPFVIGEVLDYDIRYVGVTAGTFTITVLPQKQVNGREVFHLQGHAKTLPFFNLVYRVDDTIESFFDAQGLYSHRFTMELDESKQSRRVIELYDYEKNQSYYWNRIDHVDRGYSEQKEERPIKPWSQDLLSSLYYLRSVDLPKEPGTEFRFPAIVDGKPWECVVKFSKKGTQYANSKDYPANIYTIDSYENGEPRNKDNLLWISDDEQRLILRVEAKVRVGSFAVSLDKVR